jgi:hypothetical protein
MSRETETLVCTSCRDLESPRANCGTCALTHRWAAHPRFAEVKAAYDSGEPRATKIADTLGLPNPMVRAMLAVLTGRWDYYTGHAAPILPPVQPLSKPAQFAREHMPETVMPYNLQTVVFKRCAYLEDLVAEKKREGKKFNFYQSELEGIIWLLDAVGIRYERQGHHGMDPEDLTLDPEPPRPSAVALAMAKAHENAANAAPFLEEACKRKTSYSTEEAAGRAIVRLRESKAADVQHAYPCGVCRGWHLTSLDAERSDLARQIVETRRPEKPRKAEPEPEPEPGQPAEP